MTWPTAAVTTTNVDQTTDSPAAARADLLDLIQKCNQMIAQVSSFMGGHLADTTAAAARTTLGAQPAGSYAASGANGDITNLTNLSGGLSVTGPASLGYASGAGGAVTQTGTKSTGVTLNKPTGVITTSNGAIAAGSLAPFILSNSLIGPYDNVIVTHSFGGTLTSDYFFYVAVVSSGSAIICIKNNSAGSLSEVLGINFAVIKGANA